MREEWIDSLRKKAGELRIQGEKGRIEISKEQGEMFYRYMEMLLEWNGMEE